MKLYTPSLFVDISKLDHIFSRLYFYSYVTLMPFLCHSYIPIMSFLCFVVQRTHHRTWVNARAKWAADTLHYLHPQSSLYRNVSFSQAVSPACKRFQLATPQSVCHVSIIFTGYAVICKQYTFTLGSSFENENMINKRVLCKELHHISRTVTRNSYSFSSPVHIPMHSPLSLCLCWHQLQLGY
jgi:hypothetical protein